MYINYIKNFLFKLQGATLQTFNTELVKSLEGLRERRDNILIDIKKEEEKKNEIEKIIEKIQIELENLNEHLQRKIEIRNEFERVIQNTEGAYFKVKINI